MQIGRDACAYSFELDQAARMILVDQVRHSDQTEDNQRDKPPTLPHRRHDCESNRRRLATHHTVRVYRSHAEVITAGLQVRIVDDALSVRDTPITIRALQHKLVTRNICGSKSKTHELDF